MPVCVSNGEVRNVNQVKQRLSSATDYFQKIVPPPLFATLLCAALAAFVIFVPPINGLADNGDFYRALYSNGIYKLSETNYSYLDFVTQKFGLMKYFNEYSSVNFSSQPLFVKLAVVLNKLFYSHSVFDIRFMGLVNYALYLGAIYLLTDSLTYPVKKFRNYLVALLVVFVFGDSSFTLYFNSFFAEPQMLSLTLYSFASILLIVRQRYRHNWPLFLVFIVSTVLLIANKSQNAPLALSFIVVASGLFFLPQLKKVKKIWLSFFLVIILLTGGLTYTLIGKDFVDINSYQTFSHGVLLQTKDPSKELAKNGVDEQYALMQEQDYYPKQFATIQASGKYVKKNLLSKLGFVWVVKYYATHLKQFGRLLDVAAGDTMLTQVKAVGDYTKDSGASPQKQLKFFTGYSQLMGVFFPQKFAFNCLLAAAFLIVYFVGFSNDLQEHRFEGAVRFFLVAGFLTIFIFVPIISIIGDGDADLAKHLFMVPVSIDLIFLLFISDILNQRLWHGYRKGD